MLTSGSHSLDHNFCWLTWLNTSFLIHHPFKLVKDLPHTHYLDTVWLVQILCLLNAALAGDVATEAIELVFMRQG